MKGFDAGPYLGPHKKNAKLMSRAGVTVLVALDVPDGEEQPGTQVDVASASYEGDWVI